MTNAGGGFSFELLILPLVKTPLLLLLAFCLLGCGDDIFVQPTPTPVTLSTITVQLPDFYLGTCSRDNAGRILRGEVEYRVEALLADGTVREVSTDIIAFDNTPNSNFFMVEAPSQGTFDIFFTISLECDDCCAEMFTRDGEDGCPFNSPNGDPVFTSDILMADQTTVMSTVQAMFVDLSECLFCATLCQ